MGKFFTNNFSEVNLYKKKSKKSEVTTQMIFGETFSILKKYSKWLKVKIKNDNYVGFIRRKNFSSFSSPTHKVIVLKAKTYKKPSLRNPSGEITFGSKIKALDRFSKFTKFNNMWIETKNLKPLKFRNKDIFFNVRIFKGIKYKWGGKTYKGLDCSALVQLFFNINNKFCPRDAVDQMNFFKKNVSLKSIKKNDLIYWKGHVAIALSNKKLIHAYGPYKKTVIMGIKETVKRIEKTASLKVKSIKRIN